MGTVLGVVFFAYVSLVFLVTHKICMLQCNPMSRPGECNESDRKEQRCCSFVGLVCSHSLSCDRGNGQVEGVVSLFALTLVWLFV